MWKRGTRLNSFNSSEKETYLLSHVVPLDDVRGERVEVGARRAEGVGVGRHGNDARSCAASSVVVVAKVFECSDVFLEKRPQVRRPSSVEVNFAGETGRASQIPARGARRSRGREVRRTLLVVLSTRAGR